MENNSLLEAAYQIMTKTRGSRILVVLLIATIHLKKLLILLHSHTSLPHELQEAVYRIMTNMHGLKIPAGLQTATIQWALDRSIERAVAIIQNRVLS